MEWKVVLKLARDSLKWQLLCSGGISGKRIRRKSCALPPAGTDPPEPQQGPAAVLASALGQMQEPVH